MKSIASIIAAVLTLLLCLTCGSPKEQGTGDAGPARAFTPWTHFRGNAALDGVNSSAAVSDTLRLAWTFKANGACVSSPVTDGERVYIGSLDSTLYALDISTGKPVWKFKAADEIEASPVIYKDMILIGDLSGNFYSVDRMNGSVNWQFKARRQITGAANIIEDKGYVIFGSHDNNLYSLNIADGELVWTYRSGSYINGTPAADGERIVFGGCDAQVHIVDAGTGAAIGTVETNSHIAGSAVLGNGFAYVGTYGKKLLGIDIAGMKIAWTYENDGRREPFFASPALIDTFLVAPSRDKFVHCVSPLTGEMIWRFAAAGVIEASPVIVGDRVIVGCAAGVLYLIDLKTGGVVNSFEVGGALNGTPLVSGGMVIVGDENGVVTAMR